MVGSQLIPVSCRGPRTRHTLTAAVHALPTWLVTAHEAQLAAVHATPRGSMDPGK